jgi:hypothetical protein
MFANEIIEIRVTVHGGVFIWAGRAQWAMALKVGFTCWAVWRETVTILLEEEG